jgi:hypothetical protein
MEKNNKNIRLSGNGWSARAIAIGVPSYNVDVTVNIKKRITTDEAESFAVELKSIIKEWHQDSRVLSSEHFICIINSPVYPSRDRVKSMSICCEVSVMTRQEIQLGDSSFALIFAGELQRLIDELDLEKRVESAS